MNWFNFLFSTATTELPEIFPFPYKCDDFVQTDVMTIYKRILIDVLERTEGLTDEQKNAVWDNCLGSENAAGLITLLSCAMTDKQELFIKYDTATKVIVKANEAEKKQILEDYKAKGESSVGVFITFAKYKRTDMMKIYSALEYYTVSGLYKQQNVSKAVQIKIEKLRESVGLADKEIAKTQALAVATGLKNGKDVLLDAKDEIEMAKPDLTSVELSEKFINRKRSLYLGLPASWITGEGSKGMNDTGHGDAKKVNQGLSTYFEEILKPVCDALFGKELKFISDDSDMLGTGLEALKTFDVTSNDHLSADNKTKLINGLFGLPEGEKGDPPEKIVTVDNPSGVPGADPSGGKPPAPGTKTKAAG